MVATSDSGAAGCSAASSSTGSVAAVNGLASTPYNIAVGGTQFNGAGGQYWNSVSSTNDTSVLGYIPETARNESGSVSGGSGLWATGGGGSQVYPNPSWQSAPGVPADSDGTPTSHSPRQDMTPTCSCPGVPSPPSAAPPRRPRNNGTTGWSQTSVDIRHSSGRPSTSGLSE